METLLIKMRRRALYKEALKYFEHSDNKGFCWFFESRVGLWFISSPAHYLPELWSLRPFVCTGPFGAYWFPLVKGRDENRIALLKQALILLDGEEIQTT